MAGVSGFPDPSGAATGGGVFGAEARAQYGALARLRWQMFMNGMRLKRGALELGARTFSTIVYIVIGLGIGTGAGFGAYAIAANDLKLLPIIFWILFFLWQMIPVMLASFQEQFDLGILLRFPLRFGSYYLLYLVFGLADVSTILGGLCCVGIWIGIVVARPELFAWAALGLLVFAVFNILLVRAVFAWIDRWLAQRRTREILGAVFMLVMLSFQLLNPAVWQTRNSAQHGDPRALAARKVQVELKPWMKTIYAAQKWLPPGLAADSVQEGAEQAPMPALESLAVLGIFMVGAGGVLGLRLKAEYRGENLGQAPARKKAAASKAKSVPTPQIRVLDRSAEGRMPGRSGPIAAIVEKELRSLFRTLPLLYAIGAPLLLMLLLSGAFLRGGHGPAASVFPLALPICLVYAQLGFTQIFYNNMGTEAAGLQVYFLSPTSFRTVMLAKNIFHAGMFCVVAAVALILTTLRLGPPDPGVLVATICWLTFALPMNLAVGIIFSIKMPYRVNPGRMGRQRGAQANALLSLLVQLGVIGVGATVFWLGWFMNSMLLSAGIFLVLGACAVVVWLRVLGNADAMANGRRDDLLATLMKTE